MTGAACAGLLPHEVSLPARKLPTCNITPRVKRTSFPCPAHIRRTVQQRNNAHVRVPSKPKRDRPALSFKRCRSVSFIFPGKSHAVRRADILPLDFLHDEGFHNIAFVDIVELVKSDTAFVACRNLTRIVLESLERCDTVLGDNDTVADYADLRVS